MTKFFLIIFLVAFIFFPVATFSAGFMDPVAVPTLTAFIVTVLSLMWKVFFAITVVCFVLAGIMFLTAMGDANKLKIARAAVLFGVVGVVVGILAYSIITIISSALI